MPIASFRQPLIYKYLFVLSYMQRYKASDGKEWSLVGLNKKFKDGTKFIPHGYFKGSPSPPTAWDKISPVEFQERSTVAAARDWAGRDTKVRIGVLNFASATRRGGGFETGEQAQKVSLTRASNLSLSLTQECADQFYEAHQKDDRDGFYSNAMIYSKDVTLIRDEKDNWAPPMTVDMLTSAAVNAGLVRRRMSGRPFRRDDVEKEIDGAMFERMGKILQLFVEKKVRVLVLGSFGTGEPSVLLSTARWSLNSRPHCSHRGFPELNPSCCNLLGRVARQWWRVLAVFRSRRVCYFGRFYPPNLPRCIHQDSQCAAVCAGRIY